MTEDVPAALVSTALSSQDEPETKPPVKAQPKADIDPGVLVDVPEAQTEALV